MSAIARPNSIPLFTITLFFRAFWIAIATFGLNALVPLGTPPTLVALTGVIAMFITSRVAHTRLTSIGFFVVLATLVVTNSVLFWLLHEIVRLFGATGFGVDELQLHVGTCLISGLGWSITTWIFWRARMGIILETVATLLGGVLLFANHRDFHLDQPKIVSSLAWRLGMDHLAMLIVLGSTLLVLGIAYLYIASLATRPLAERERVQRFTAKKQWALGATLATATVVILYIIQQMVYAHFNAIMLARVANGVGMNSESGVSPLSFQSALGSTNQPAALVRLEGDYANNPFSPMMYMRESALSAFNGKEMVFAGRAYDSDLPVTSSRDTFSRKEDAELGQRTPLVQSVYLLAEHDHAFAVDYPVSIVQLKNPRPQRFKATYRAYSVAPAYAIAGISSSPVGDPRWTPDEREHYLTPHPDRRYSDLAREITKDASQPIEKMLALTNHLSRTAIYTLTPNHTVKPDEDQVAPFLFGDHRGYCVHFAHALVYMARSLSIPARIGTGYLTDLSQAKDGHILLRMSDRHAWAEVFISGIGWVPFDVQPDQVESHAETQVDSKLLEELMGVLEPGEEILPTETAKDEPGMEEAGPVWTPSRDDIIGTLLAILSLCALAKLLLREGWRIAPSPALKLRWGYISLASFLHDLGMSREYGETRSQFANRSPHGSLSDISELLVTSAYSETSRPSGDRVVAAIMRGRAHLKTTPVSKRMIALLNPGSLVKTITGGRW